MSDRWDRQIRLRNVGPAGQARIGAARVQVDANSDSDLLVRYLDRAGVQIEGDAKATSPASAEVLVPRSCPHRSFFRHEASRSVAESSWQALELIRRILEIDR